MPVLNPRQTRQVVTLGFLFVIGLSLLFTLPQLQHLMLLFNRGGTAPEPPPVEGAPAPPPSPHAGAVRTLDTVLKSVQDKMPLEMADRDPAYLKLVEYVSSVPPDRMRESAEGELAYATYLKYAPELRGRVFRVRGESLQEVHPVRLVQPAGGREDVYRHNMVDEGADAGFVVDLVDRPATTTERRETVEVEGFFFGTVTFENKYKQVREAPLLVARSYRKYVPASESAPDRLWWYKVGL